MSGVLLAELLGLFDGNDWRQQAACRGVDPEIFTVAHGHDPQQYEANIRALQLCDSCPVLANCEELRQKINPYGVIFAGHNGNLGRPVVHACGTKAARKRHCAHQEDCRACDYRYRGRKATADCGTRTGFNAHRNRGEDPCQPCRDADNAYRAGWRAVTPRVRGLKVAA
jgi:hypothetical protein